jgi:predicted nucleic acid-binding protein
MAANALVDAGFLVALLNPRDTHHRWTIAEAERHPRPWKTCEAVLSETFHLLGTRNASLLSGLLRRQTVAVAFDLGDHVDRVLQIMEKYGDVPASLADACLVRMSEIVDDALVLTTDSDFRIYRRHSRHAIPCVTPS